MENTKMQLEHDIMAFVKSENGAMVHFEYSHDSFLSVTVSAFTTNAENKEPFLLKVVRAKTEELALEEILDYVKNKSGMDSFTVKWRKKGTDKTEVSYFYCHDVIDVVKKFFVNKDSVDYIIYEITLNPLS